MQAEGCDAPWLWLHKPWPVSSDQQVAWRRNYYLTAPGWGLEIHEWFPHQLQPFPGWSKQRNPEKLTSIKPSCFSKHKDDHTTCNDHTTICDNDLWQTAHSTKKTYIQIQVARTLFLKFHFKERFKKIRSNTTKPRNYYKQIYNKLDYS